MDVNNPSRNPKYVAVLALVASLVLAIGWLVRPRDIPERAAPLPSETELEQLARRAERRALDDMAAYFAGAARDVEGSIVRLRGTQMSGVVWNDRLIVTAPLTMADGPAPIDLAGVAGHASVQPVVWGPNLPLAAVARPAEMPDLTPARRPAAPPDAGAWVLAVWSTDGKQAFATGNFHQVVSITCNASPAEEAASSLSLTAAMAGGGVFNADGALLGVILPCGDRMAAISTASVQAMIDRADTIPQRVLGRYGFAASRLSDEEQDYFKSTDGLLVREVWPKHAAEKAGMRPGDIIMAVSGTPITGSDNLVALTASADMPFELAVRRGSRSLVVSLPADTPTAPREAPAAGAGVVLASATRSYLIDAVQPGSAAARAGVQAGDRLLRINHTTPPSLDRVRRVLAAQRLSPMWLEVERNGRLLGMLLR